MSMPTFQQHAANMMAAAAHLLVGKPGHHKALNDKLAIMYGAAIHPLNLVHWIDWVRASGRAIIHISFPDAEICIPTIAMVTVDDGHGRACNNCSLWLPPSGGGAWLIPDARGWGAYRVDADLILRHHARPPVRSGQPARLGHIRAYRRLLEIAAGQGEADLELPSPIFLEERAA